MLFVYNKSVGWVTIAVEQDVIEKCVVSEYLQ